jgi:hypothetical protein
MARASRAAKAEQTGKERAAAAALADRVARAKAATPPRDPTGEHHEAMAAIARASGRDVVDLLDLWDERAAIYQYVAGVDRPTAERQAVDELERLFAPRQEHLL